MTREQKDLLIKDLCGRLSHGVKCKILETNEVKILASIQYDGENTLFDFWEDDQKIRYGYQLYLSEFKPYLFPLLSMTMGQAQQWHKYANDKGGLAPMTDWLDAHNFDYRDLIKMGLVDDATGLNIYK